MRSLWFSRFLAFINLPWEMSSSELWAVALVNQSWGLRSINHPSLTEIGVRVVCGVTPETRKHTSRHIILSSNNKVQTGDRRQMSLRNILSRRSQAWRLLVCDSMHIKHAGPVNWVSGCALILITVHYILRGGGGGGSLVCLPPSMRQGLIM